MVRSDDTQETLTKKVRLATILGTFQCTLVHFPYLRKIWQQNTEEENLLGVSLTGQMDNLGLYKGEISLEKLREVAVVVNDEYSSNLGINRSTAITCVN